MVFSSNTFVKLHGKKYGSHNMTVVVCVEHPTNSLGQKEMGQHDRVISKSIF